MARGPSPYIQSIVWKFVDRGLGKAKRLLGDYSDEAGEATDATKRMNLQAAQNTATMKAMAEAEEDAADEAEDMSKSARKASGAIDRMKNSSNGAVRAMGRLAAKIRGAATSAKVWVAGGIAAGIIAFSGAVAGATYKATQFEAALNEARKTADLSEEEFQSLSKQLLDVQAELGTSQQDLAAIAAEAGRLGIEGSDNIAEFTRTVSLLSEATVVTADQAAQGLARISNAFGLPISRAKALGSVLNELSNQTVANTADLVDALTRVGASADGVGLTVDQVAALSATLIDAGVSARRAGTGLRVIFTRLVNESDKVADQMEVTEEQLIQTYQENGLKAVKQYLQALEDLPQAQRSAAVEDVFGSEQSQKVLALVKNFDNLEKQIAAAGNEIIEADSVTAEFAKTTLDVRKEWNRLTAKLSAWVTEWGTEFTGYLEEILAKLNDASGGANEVARDLTMASERLAAADEDIQLVARFQALEAQGEDTAAVMEEMQSRFPSEFFRETADGIQVATGRLKEYLTQQRSMADQSVQQVQTRAVKRLQSAWLQLQRAQARAQQEGLSVEEWREYQKRIEGARERLQAIAKTFVGQFAEGGEVARDQMKAFAESVDLRSFIGLSDISEDEALDKLISLWREYRTEKEKAAETDGTGGGETSEDVPSGPGDPGFKVEQIEDGAQTLQELTQENLGSLLQKAKKINEEASGFVDSFGSNRLKTLLEGYNSELDRMRLKLERGTISQEEFARRSAQAAKRYREELKEILDWLEKMGLISEDEVQAALDAFDALGDESEDAKESVQGIGETLQDVAGLVGGITDVADAFGDLDDETKKALDAVGTLVDQTGRLIELKNEADSFSELFSSPSGAISGVSSIVGAVGGIASLLSSIGGDDQQKERIKELNSKIGEQIAALRENTEALYEQAQVGSEISQERIEEVRKILQNIPQQAGNENQLEQDIAQVEELGGPFEEFGGTVSSLTDAAFARADRYADLFNKPSKSEVRKRVLEALTGQRSLSNTFEGPGDASGFDLIRDDFLKDKLGSGFTTFDERLQQLGGQLGQFGDSVAGLSAEVRLRKEEIGQSFSELRGVLMSRIRNVGLGGLDALIRRFQGASQEELSGLATDLREVIVGDRSLNSVFPDVQTGTLQEELGDVSSDELSDLLQTIDSIVEVGTGDSSSGGQSDRATRVRSQVQRSITEIQANQLLSYQQGQLFQLRGIKAILRSGLNVPDSVGALAASSTDSAGGATYTFNFDVSADMGADEISQKLEEAIQQANI